MMDHPRADFWLGIGLMLAGVTFRWYAIRYLCRYYSPLVAVQTDHQVVQSEPYRWIRHPAYTGGLITLLGYGLVLNLWVSLITIFAISLLGIWYRVQVEEYTLVDILGQP